MIQFKSVSKTYQTGRRALKSVSFEIDGPKIVGVIGRNGAWFAHGVTMPMLHGISRDCQRLPDPVRAGAPRALFRAFIWLSETSGG